MAQKNGHSIIPDMPGNEKDHSAEAKRAVVTDIDSLIEPPSKKDNEGVTAASLERAVKAANIPMGFLFDTALLFPSFQSLLFLF